MQYFDQDTDKPERIGKVIGDIFAAFIVIALVVIYTQSFIFR